MYVKLFNQILQSSISRDRRLRHFFIDFLLLADPDGNVRMIPEAISKMTGASMEEVEWGLKELSKPDPGSAHKTEEGRRIIPLEGFGYGWKIVNYELYRDFKTSKQQREAIAKRVRECRERKKPRRSVSTLAERLAVKAMEESPDGELHESPVPYQANPPEPPSVCAIPTPATPQP